MDRIARTFPIPLMLPIAIQRLLRRCHFRQMHVVNVAKCAQNRLEVVPLCEARGL